MGHIMELRSFVNDNRRRLLGIGIIIVLIGGGIAVAGVPMIEASNTCSTVTVSCHGVPVGESCYGVTQTERSIVDASACDAIETIGQQCTAIRNITCDQHNVSGMGWTEQTKVEGLSCARWDEAYDLGLARCQ